MDTTEFLEYLHGHDATRELAEALAEVLIVRRLVPSRVPRDAGFAPMPASRPERLVS